MKKMNYGSFSCIISVTTDCTIISQKLCDYEADTIFYAVERFFTHCNTIAKKCTKTSWQFRIAKGKSPKKQSFMYIVPAILMELPGNWVKISGNIDAVGVNVNKIEMLSQYPSFSENPIKVNQLVS